MTGTYRDSQGKLLSVIRTTRKGRSYYEIGEVRGIGLNRLFIEISEPELKRQLKEKLLTPCI